MVVVHAFDPPALGRQSQAVSEFEAILVYRASSRTVGYTEKPCLQNKQTRKQETDASKR